MLVKSTLEEFNQILGSSSPAPGGGSVAALSGALAANLVSMVCNLTLGKEEYKDSQALIGESLAKAQALAIGLLARVDLDTQAFNGVMAAFKLPRSTEEEKLIRGEGIQTGYKEAVHSPLGIGRECLEVLRLAQGLLGRFNTNAMSDLGVAAQQALAGLEGAVMNVKINLPSIKDQEFVREMRLKVAAQLEEGRTLGNMVYRYVQENLG